jgi:hypothetical protein
LRLFELADWEEHAKGSSDVTVALGATDDSVNVFDPTIGSEPVKTLAQVDSVPLT